MERKLHDLITADKFDKDAFIAKSGELVKLHEKMESSMTEAFATALSKLPADERKTLADAMHEVLAVTSGGNEIATGLVDVFASYTGTN